MPWQASCIMDEKVKFIAMLLERPDMSMSQVCASFGISRKTGYKWVSRYHQDPEHGLLERCRAPHRHPQAIGAEQGQMIVAARQRFPYWGPKKLRLFLLREHPSQAWPAASSIGELLKREGLVKPRRRRSSGIKVERPDFLPMNACNQVWCVDFKGPVCADRCFSEPLTVMDGASRYLLDCRLTGKSGAEVWPRFELLFRRYGLPRAIRSDNGSPFASTGLHGLTPLAIKWVKLGIDLERIRAGHPEENGRHERLHRSLNEYVRHKGAGCGSRASLQGCLDAFSVEYNEIRGHESLEGRTPDECYQGSERVYPERLPEPDYGVGVEVRRVRHSGAVRFKGRVIYVSESLIGELVGISEQEDGGWLVRFHHLDLGVIDPVKHKFSGFRPALKGRSEAAEFVFDRVNHSQIKVVKSHQPTAIFLLADAHQFTDQTFTYIYNPALKAHCSTMAHTPHFNTDSVVRLWQPFGVHTLRALVALVRRSTLQTLMTTYFVIFDAECIQATLQARTAAATSPFVAHIFIQAPVQTLMTPVLFRMTSTDALQVYPQFHPLDRQRGQTVQTR